ncbi:type II toxin-antitoxin system HicB family antitoxin [Chlorogloeopsis sp. ULAP01]|uniref:type II toxin-antitoxin system HicB family antitoxin n=1 Tax=Chlorogloeopsis sp. ULAP01 TaxID=3056483 RepID=UPI0025AB5994|nr:type II toxin-antitoxin system HicB family antitoxin [Chlorogloeopsis sp. ULAP01]MDM9382695.1 type II toxin-antitoxin system HicB family antitoxin [Chlorogloeopsis sp. ULAP01]
MKWRVILEEDPETGEWAVWCPELPPGCTSVGETEEEALENIKEAIQLYLQQEEIELAPGAIAREINV